MTFGELRAFTRRYVIADLYEDAYSDDMLDNALWLASVETAAALDIPRAVTTVDIPAGAQAFQLPDARRIITLSVAGYPAASADLREVAALWDGGGNRPVKLYNFDPRRADQVVIAPSSPGGTALVEYVAALTRPDPFDDGEPWDGLLAPYHVLVAYRAGLELFRADERENETESIVMQYQNRLAEASAFLGRTDVPNLVVPDEARDDEGARG